MCRQLQQPEQVKALRRTLGQFPTGVAIVTACDENGHPIGMTINSFCSVSLMPPLVSWCIDRKSVSYRAFATAKAFTISLLDVQQEALAKRFATQGADKFADLLTINGVVPKISDGCGWFECITHQVVPLGDHLLVVGQVIDFECYNKKPLVFAKGEFSALNEQEYMAA